MGEIKIAAVRRPLTAVAAATAFVAAACLLVGCTSAAQPDDAAPADKNEPTTSADGTRDLSGGGTCAQAEDITINTEGAQAVIDGECGTVMITGDKVTGNIESAKTVVVRGKDASLLGKNWGAVTLEGNGGTVNVDEIRSLEAKGEGVTIINLQAKSVSLDGNKLQLNSNGVERLSVTGNNAVVVVAGDIGELAVTGSDNTFNWSGGAEAPSSDRGTGNVYTR